MTTTQQDLFIAAALQGLLAGRTPDSKYTTADVARIAVECAHYVIMEINKPVVTPVDGVNNA